MDRAFICRGHTKHSGQKRLWPPDPADHPDRQFMAKPCRKTRETTSPAHCTFPNSACFLQHIIAPSFSDITSRSLLDCADAIESLSAWPHRHPPLSFLHLPLSSNTMSDAKTSLLADDGDVLSGASVLGIDIEHIADSNTWAEQAWRLIRERREHERKEVEDRERARLDEQQKRRKDEKDWRERQVALSQQRAAAAIDTSDLPSSSAHRRAQTARHEKRGEAAEALSALDLHASATSGWQQRGILHVWASEGSREQEERERKEIWEGNMRGKRAQLEKLDADRKRRADQQTATKHDTQRATTADCRARSPTCHSCRPPFNCPSRRPGQLGLVPSRHRLQSFVQLQRACNPLCSARHLILCK